MHPCAVALCRHLRLGVLAAAGAAVLWVAAVGTADAASRVVITAPGPVKVVLDQQPVSGGAGMGRITLPAVPPGRHHLVLLDPGGTVLYQATIDVPDNISGTVAWDGVQATLSGVSEVTGTTADADTPFADPADAPEQADTAALERAQDENPENGLASRHGQGEQVDHRPVGGRVPYEVTQVTGAAVNATVGNPIKAVEPAVSAATGGFAYMVNTAAAGGVRKRYDPASRQGNPDVPPPVLEKVKLRNTSGAPLTVFVDGMWLHDFEDGATEHAAELEVGRRELQFVDRRSRELIYQGSLRIKEDYVIELSFSDTEPPRAVNANWAWAPL